MSLAAASQVGQTLLVRPGERLPTDGTVRSGRSSLDTSTITGESIPVEVTPGDEVLAGSINSSGALEVEATAAGTDNSLTTIVDLVEQAQAEKGERARLADRIARPLVPGVDVLAVVVALVGSLFGDPELWTTRALIVLQVAAFPCALGSRCRSRSSQRSVLPAGSASSSNPVPPSNDSAASGISPLTRPAR